MQKAEVVLSIWEILR